MKVNEASHRLTLMLCMMHKKCYLKIAAGKYFCIRGFRSLTKYIFDLFIEEIFLTFTDSV